MEHLGQKYLVRCTKGGYKYYFCKFKLAYNCPGSIKVSIRDGEVVVVKGHSNHDHPRQNVVNQFRSILSQRAARERETLRNIYDQEAAQNPDAAIDYPYPRAVSIMQHARRQINPPIPATLEELGNLIVDPQWGERFHCKIGNDIGLFCRATVVCDAGTAVFLASTHLLDLVVGGVEEVHVDGTFKCTPASPPSHQLLTIHFIIRNKSIPVAFILMSSRLTALYIEIFERLKIYAPTLHPNLIIIDFERALRNALMHSFPNSEIVGCFYHYASAVWKMASRLGYVADMEGDRKKAIKMIMSLPLLPADHFREGLEAIQIWCRNGRQINLNNLFAYIQRYWIQSVGPEHISVYNLPRRTNNNVEAFNKILLTKMGFHPNVFLFLEKLIQLTVRAGIEYQQLQRGQRISRAMSSRYLGNDQRIRDAQRAWANNEFPIIHFLEIVAHAVEHLANDLRQAPDIRQENLLANEEPQLLENEEQQLLPPEPDIIDDEQPIEVVINPDDILVIIEDQPEAPEQVLVPDPVLVPEPELLEEHNQEFRCAVCMVHPLEYACIPCGHFCLCQACKDRIEQEGRWCVVCRNEINSFQRIFLA